MKNRSIGTGLQEAEDARFFRLMDLAASGHALRGSVCLRCGRVFAMMDDAPVIKPDDLCPVAVCESVMNE